jgi:hypothetical protein
VAVKGSRKKSKPKISTEEMEVAIAKYFGIRQHIVVPNVSWGFFNHECDLFFIRKSGYGFEVEIKRTKSDMVADFKKKHGHKDRRNRIVQLYYAFPEELLSKVKDLVPEDCGIITVEYYGDGIKEYRGYARMHRDAKRRKGAKRLTEKEQLQIARLGTLRIWTLKEKLNLLKQKK